MPISKRNIPLPLGVAFAVTLTIVFLIAAAPLAAAAPDQPSIEWTRTYTGLQLNSVIQTSDGGYAIAGTGFGAQGTLIKLDSFGGVQWQQGLGDAVSIVQIGGSGYVLFAENGYVVKTDSDGNFQSSFTVGLDGVSKGVLATDGNYVLVGNSRGATGDTFAWLHKVDPQGNLLWNKTFTGGFVVRAVTETFDRGCAIAGNWKNGFWLAKIDSNSNLQWSQTFTYGNVLDTHFAYSLAKTKDGGYILAGTGDWQSSGGLIPWLLKIDSQGHEQWNLPYAQFPQDSFSAVVQTDDEGYAVLRGKTPSLMRMDSSGSELWSLALDGGLSPSNYDSTGLIRTTDGGYAVTGTTLGTTGFIVKLSPETLAAAPAIAVLSPTSATYESADVPLTFTVNKPAASIFYSLDGRDNVTIGGNTTLTGLPVGAHTLIVYATDSSGATGSSSIIQFTVSAPFPTALVASVIVIAVVVAVAVLFYFKRETLAIYRKRGLKSLLGKQSFAAMARNRIVWTVTIIGVCFLLVVVQLFFPYAYFSSVPRGSNSTFEMGVSYVYEQDNLGQIFNEVARIKDLGFGVIRINMVVDSANPSAYKNTLTNVFFSAIRQLGGIKVALIINNLASIDDLNYYFQNWGGDLAYIQILNEPDVASSWQIGALFSDDEAISKFEQIYVAVQQRQLSAELYTNFGQGFVVRTSLPVRFSGKLDFVGFDVFMDSFLTLSPAMIQFLQELTNKEIVITEFGMSTGDDTAQSDYIIRGLNLFRNMGLRGCWLVYWNSANNNYGIRGRLAEQKVGEWIAQNA